MSTAKINDKCKVVLAPITMVTVMEDRARIERMLNLSCTEGVQVIKIENVSPVIVDKSLFAETCVSGVSVENITVLRRRLMPDDTLGSELDELRKTKRQLEQLITEQEELVHKLDNLQQKMNVIKEHTFQDLVEDVSFDKFDDEVWQQNLEQLLEREDKNVIELQQAKNTLFRQKEEFEQLKQKIERLSRLDDKRRADIILHLNASKVEDAEIRIAYTVPCACWRPSHVAQIPNVNSEPLTFSSYGSVWQNTGEDWENVQLNFSTQTLLYGLEPPELEPDMIFKQEKSKYIETEEREQVIHDTGLGRSGGEKKSAVPGIETQGEEVNLKALHKATIPANGMPYKVLINTFEADFEQELIAIPEKVDAVIVKTIQANQGGIPILPGPVDLIKNNGVFGQTHLDYIAPQENFAIGWGPDSQITISRVVDTYQHTESIISNWRKTNHRIINYLSNLSNDEKILTLTERIPVSEIEKVSIEFVDESVEPATEPDDNGFVKWELTLPPYGHQKVAMMYIYKKHNKVVS